MRFSPVLLFHIAAGTLGFLSGAFAVSFRKGSHRHALAGNVFVASMLTLAATGVYLAIVKSQPGNILGGVLTFYLVATAWITARRGSSDTGIFDWAALAVVSALAVVTITFGIDAAKSPTGFKYEYPPGPYFFLGVVSVIAALGDVRLLIRRGISGTPRLARHLWRMCFAFFIAAASIFLARQQIFPALLRKTGVLSFLSFFPLGLMIFWLIRVRVSRTFQRRTIAAQPSPYSLPT